MPNQDFEVDFKVYCLQCEHGMLVLSNKGSSTQKNMSHVVAVKFVKAFSNIL